MIKNPYWFELKGSIRGNGRREVYINKRIFKYHRIVYYLHNPQWDIHNSSTDNSIDHIDRNPLNNFIENLRVVSHKQNQWNQDRKGYCFHKARGKYQAQIRVDGKVKYLGYFENEDDAKNAYLNAKAIHHIIE